MFAFHVDCHVSLAAPAQKGQQESPWPGDVPCSVACLSGCSASFVMPSAPQAWRPAQPGPSSDEFRAQLKKWKLGVPIAVVAYGEGPGRPYSTTSGQHTSHFVVVHRALVAMFRGPNLVVQYIESVRAQVCAERDGRCSIHANLYDARHDLPTNPLYGGWKAHHRAPKGTTGIHPECWPSVFEQNGFPNLLLKILSAPCQLVLQGPRAQVHALRSLCLPLSGSAARAACTAQHRQAFSSPACSAPWE